MTHFLLLAIVYLALVSLGLPNGLLGVTWPAIRADMGQPLAAVGYITIIMTFCSAASSFWAGAITKRLGTGAVVAVSCLATVMPLVVAVLISVLVLTTALDCMT